MRYATVCSGIEAPSQAWHPLGWTPVFFSEIEKHPSRVLKHRYPHVPNHGDMTKFRDWPDHAIDLLCGGTPCQGFSIAGLRGGLDDDRSQLSLVFAQIARRYRPKILIWENVPGVLSSDEGRDFGTFLGLLAGRRVTVPRGGWQNAGVIPGYERAYGLAWRIIDAQFARSSSHPRAVPQRRRRVFVTGYLGDWRRAAAILLERESLCWNPPPRREAGQGAAPTIASRPTGGGGLGTDFDCDGGLIPTVANPLTARMVKGVNTTMDEGQTMVAQAFKPSHFTRGKDGAPSAAAFALSADADKGDQDQLVIAIQGAATRLIGGDGGIVGALAADAGAHQQNYIAFSSKDHGADAGGQVAIAFDARQSGVIQYGEKTGPLDTHGYTMAVAFPSETFNMDGVTHGESPDASQDKAYSRALLRRVREEIGEDAFVQWGLGILLSIHPSQVLQSPLHGQEFRQEAQSGSGVDGFSSPRETDNAPWTVRAMREAERLGRSPPGPQLSEQCSVELGAYLSGLPHQGTPPAWFLRDLWTASEGLGILQQALHTAQEMGRPARHESKPAQTTWAVRRLTPLEATRLQGFPDDFWDGLNIADGPKYKMLGNSMSTNVMTWLGERIALVLATRPETSHM